MRKYLIHLYQPLIYVCVIALIGILTACEPKKDLPARQPKRKKVEARALSMIRKDDCLTCHSIEDKSAAPAYLKIAQRYEADETTVNKLADKIITGGGGMWGGVMTEHRFL